jgi:hypothetical protein
MPDPLGIHAECSSYHVFACTSPLFRFLRASPHQVLTKVPTNFAAGLCRDSTTKQRSDIALHRTHHSSPTRLQTQPLSGPSSFEMGDHCGAHENKRYEMYATTTPQGPRFPTQLSELSLECFDWRSTITYKTLCIGRVLSGPIVSVQGHKETHTTAVYLDPDLVEFVG